MSETSDDIYNPSSIDLEAQTLPLDQILINAMNSRLLETYVCLPAKVTKVNSDNKTVNIQTLLKRKYITGSTTHVLPEVQQVIVASYRGDDYFVNLPVSVGDTGLALFCDRSLEVWTYSDGKTPVDPQDSRNHDLTDAIFIPGFYPAKNPPKDTGTDLTVNNGQLTMSLKKNGRFQVKNNSTELVSLLSDLLQTLLTATVQTALGPQPFTPNTIVLLNKIKTLLDTMKE